MLGRYPRKFFSGAKKLSYACGISDLPLSSETIGGMLRKQAHDRPDQLFQVYHQKGIEYSYKEFDQRVDEIAKGFIALGLQPGDRVGMYAYNRPEWSLTQYACARANLILVNVNPAFQTDDLEYALNKVGIKWLVMQEQFSKSHYVDIVRHLVPELGADGTTHVNSEMVPALEHVVVTGSKRHRGMINFKELYSIHTSGDGEEMARREAEADFEDPVNIQFTSGTTGFPKGATLTHHNLINNALFHGLVAENDENTRMCISVPLYHTMGMGMGNLSMLVHGGTSVYPMEGFSADGNLQAIDKYKCNSVIGVPTMFTYLVKEFKDNPGKYDVTDLSRGVIAGSICTEELLRKWESILGIEYISVSYGMSETSPISFQVRREAPLDKKISTVGTVLPHTEGKIIDEKGATVPVGHKGEICTRGYLVMDEYFNDPEKTDETVTEKGWVLTGDQGIMDEDGYLEIVGRVKDLIIRGGENVTPKEIENLLMEHPEVQDCQVIGVFDEIMGEEIMACIMMDNPNHVLSRTDVYEFLHGNIAHFKIPKYIKMVKEYPMTVTGKIKKNVMRDEANKVLREVHSDDWEYDHDIYT